MLTLLLMLSLALYDERYPSLQAEKTALFGSAAYDQQSHYEDFRDRFNAIIEDPESVSPALRNYLINCAGRDPTNGPIDYRHRDEWITRLAYENMTVTGRTFGVADPENLSEVDPLGLRFQTDGVTLRTDVVFIDPQGANENAAPLDAPVRVVPGGNTVTTPTGGSKTTTALFNTSGFSLGEKYNYQFWTNITGLDEDGGASTRMRILQAGANIANTTVTFYVRYSTLHEIDHQIYLGKQPTADGGSHAKRIIVRGYPTDAIPQIRCSIPIIEGTPDTLPAGDLGATIRAGAAADQARDNMDWRWLWFVGNRDIADFNGVAGKAFASKIFLINAANNNWSFRFCAFTDWVCIDPLNADAGSVPEYVDIVHGSRDAAANNGSFNAIVNNSPNLRVDYCYFKGAGTDIPFDYADATTAKLYARAIYNQGTGLQVSHSTFEGFCSGDYVGVTTAASPLNVIADVWIHHNTISCNGYNAMTLIADDDDGTEYTVSGVVEDNFIFNSATADVQPSGGNLIQAYPNHGQITLRRNVFANEIDGQLTDRQSEILLLKVNGSVGEADSVIEFYENITHNAIIRVGASGGSPYTNADTVLATVEITQNLIGGPSPLSKEENSGTNKWDGSVVMSVFLNSLMGNDTVSNNNIYRDPGDDNATVAMAHPNAASAAAQFAVTDTRSGFENNTAIDPQYADAANGDFTVGDAALALLVPNTPKTRTAVGAWRPPGV